MTNRNSIKLRILFFAGLLCLFCAIDLSAQNKETSVQTDRPDTIPPGVQGAINPLLENKVVLTGADLLDQSFPNSWPLFGTGIRMTVGGYVKADFIRDFDYVGDRYEFELGSIAVDGTPERDMGGVTTFHAKESRVNFDLRSSAKWKNGKEYPMQVFVEFDWFFDSPSMALNTRLRHAYGVIGRLLIGRTWTLSGDLAALPGTIDFSAGDALYGGRATQIRWQDKLSPKFTYAFALEDAFAQIDNPYGLDGGYRTPAPNMAGMIKWHGNKGSSIQLGLDGFWLNWKGSSTVPDVSKMGYALTVTSRVVFNVTQYHDAFLWGGGFCEGQAHKIIALSWDGKASGVITPDGLHLSPAWWGLAGYNHYWSKNLNSTISTAWAGTELTADQLGSTIKKAGSMHVNLVWFPYPLVSTGIEYMWGMRENHNGVQGTASRIQFMAKFKFH